MIKMYVLNEPRFDHVTGTVVYEQVPYDYGLASDDTNYFGEQHISVTLNSDGGYPGFTVPMRSLTPIPAQIPGIQPLNLPKPCSSPNHFPPTHLVVPEGHYYSHQCPGCGMIMMMTHPVYTLKGSE